MGAAIKKRRHASKWKFCNKKNILELVIILSNSLFFGFGELSFRLSSSSYSSSDRKYMVFIWIVVCVGTLDSLTKLKAPAAAASPENSSIYLQHSFVLSGL